MFWGCCAASDTGYLDRVHGIMKSGDYQGGILELNVQPGVRSWVSVEGHGSCSRTMTPNTLQKAPRNGSRQNTGMF